MGVFVFEFVVLCVYVRVMVVFVFMVVCGCVISNDTKRTQITYRALPRIKAHFGEEDGEADGDDGQREEAAHHGALCVWYIYIYIVCVYICVYREGGGVRRTGLCGWVDDRWRMGGGKSRGQGRRVKVWMDR